MRLNKSEQQWMLFNLQYVNENEQDLEYTNQSEWYLQYKNESEHLNNIVTGAFLIIRQ
jgi:hypothetical protein